MLEAVTTDSLSGFDQIEIEMHFLTYPKYREGVIRCMKKINLIHQAIHIHANNNGRVAYGGDLIKLDFDGNNVC